MRDVFQDLRFALRTLFSRPSFTIPALLTLGVGLGASTAVFSVVNGVLLSPLNFPLPNQLVTIREAKLEDGSRHGVAPPNLSDWRMAARSVRVSLVSSSSIVLKGEDAPSRISAVEVSPDFFELLQVHPLLGRTFPANARENSDEVVISHDFWKERFGSDAGVLGRILETEDRDLEVVGVLAKDFYFPQTGSIWISRVLDGEQLTASLRNARYMSVVGRVREGSSMATASQELSAINQEHPLNRGWTVQVASLQQQLVDPVARTLWILLAGVALVFLVACSNVTHLLLSRGLMRTREFAMRSALGASRPRLVRQILTETLLLFLMGGALGTMLSLWAVEPLLAAAPVTLPRVDNVAINGTVIAVGVLTALLSGLSFGLMPALRLSGRGLFDSLRSGSQIEGHRARTGRHRQLLVGVQIALSAILLVGAALLMQSLLHIESVPLGFQSEDTISFSVMLPASRYDSEPKRASFSRQLRERLKSLPEVESVGASTNLPLSGSSMTFGFRPLGLNDDPKQEFGQYHATTPGYFEAMRIPLQEGRFFNEADHSEASQVVIVNETLARRFWPNDSAVGKRLQAVSRGGPVEREIVGVVATVLHASLTSNPGAELYVPYQQDAWPFLSVVVRPSQNSPVVPAIRRELRRIDPLLPLDAVGKLQGLVATAAAPARFRTMLITLFAGVALLIAAIGIYGLIGFSVSQRTQEIGIRMAMGAPRHSILRLIVGNGLVMALWGTALGLLGAYFSVGALESLLFGVTSSDFTTFAFVGLTLPAVATIASWLPARRAARLNVVRALRIN